MGPFYRFEGEIAGINCLKKLFAHANQHPNHQAQGPIERKDGIGSCSL